MKRRFSLSEIATASAIALGLALACQASSAQDIVGGLTVTQQGKGNTSNAEQAGLGYRADVNQAGSGNYTHICQH